MYTGCALELNLCAQSGMLTDLPFGPFHLFLMFSQDSLLRLRWDKNKIH